MNILSRKVVKVGILKPTPNIRQHDTDCKTTTE